MPGSELLTFINSDLMVVGVFNFFFEYSLAVAQPVVQPVV
jgi:hypothetical protein